MSASLRQAAVNVAAVRAEAHRIRRQAARLGMAVAPDGSISVDPLGLPVSPAAVELIGHQIRGVVRSADEADRRAARALAELTPARPHGDVILATGNPA